MDLSPRVTALSKSATLKITALTRKLISEGKDVVNFAAGEPDFDTPDFVKDAAKQAIDAGFTKYTPSAGIPALRQAIAEKLRRENRIECCEKNIIVTAGAKYAIFAAFAGVLDAGDEVIIPAPFWVSYPEMAKLIGANPVFLATDAAQDFKLDPAGLKKAITSRTKMLVLNYPANPTGMTYSVAELSAINDVAQKAGLFVLSDEIYESLVYDGAKHVSFAALPGAFERTFTVNGFSKSFSMTGWRMGYLCGAESAIEQISKIIDHTTSCATSISQKGALAALSNRSWQRDMLKEFTARRDLLWKGLSSIPKIKPYKSQGTFYMFCDIRASGMTSMDFAANLLEKELVSLVPADDFGAPGFVRISFATSQADITKGLTRLKSFLL
jgi:aspartate aminotransferase